MQNNVGKYINCCYVIGSNEDINDNILNELKKINVYNKSIKYVQYNLEKSFTDLKYFKKEAIIRAIKHANTQNYSKILIIHEDCIIFNDNKFINTFTNSNIDMFVINPSDICNDCFVLNKKAISYIGCKKINYNTYNWWDILWEDLLNNTVVATSDKDICRYKIDYVVTYVNNEDKEWQSEYNKYKLESRSNKENRWRDWNNFVFNLRAIEKNLPWIDNVYVIVSSLSQVPEWVTDKVNIVLHKDIIPEKLLPTFNSCTIECFLCNIKNLSEYFIYGNDDVFVMNTLSQNDFFDNGKIVAEFKNIKDDKTNFHRTCINSFKFTMGDFNKFHINLLKKSDPKLKMMTHTLHPIIKSTGLHLYKRYQSKITKSCTRFRSEGNLNQYIYDDYDYIAFNYKKSNIKNNFTTIECVTVIQDNIDILCINDNGNKYENIDYLQQNINYQLYIKFSECSKYDNKCIHIDKPIDKLKDIKIDFIFPYVDCDDIEWIKEYNKYCPKEKTRWTNWSAGIERFRGNDLLKYMFRSVEQYMPWINKMWMIVMQESQIPKWVNRNTVNIVYHSDFIDKSVLPTFNSTTIEMFLPNIKHLSEYFIYSNDDVYITNKLNKTAFFVNGIPVFHLNERKISTQAIGDPIRKNALNMATNNINDNLIVYDTLHICFPYIKSNMLKLYNDKYNKILNTCTPFREPINSNQYMWLYNQAFNYSYINRKISRYITYIDKLHKYDIDYSKYRICCINDSNNSSEKDLLNVKNKLENMFPNKSKYEI